MCRSSLRKQQDKPPLHGAVRARPRTLRGEETVDAPRGEGVFSDCYLVCLLRRSWLMVSFGEDLEKVKTGLFLEKVRRFLETVRLGLSVVLGSLAFSSVRFCGK